jgi:hypothetical protein
MIEISNRNDKDTRSISLEEPTTIYTCQQDTVTTATLLRDKKRKENEKRLTMYIVSLKALVSGQPYIVRISVIGFCSFRESVTAFGCFRLFMCTRPNTRNEDWTEAYR